MRALAASFAPLLLATPLVAVAAKAVVLGPTYPIAEPDTRDEIRQRAGRLDWNAWMKRMPEEYSAFVGAHLPRATETSTRLFDPTYILPEDIRDAEGKLIAPKGLPINVYRRIKVPFRYIVIGDTPEDLQWLRETAKPATGDKILLASGNALKLRKETGIPVFLLEDLFIKRFGLRAIPAIVQQEGHQLRIAEYYVPVGRGPGK